MNTLFSDQVSRPLADRLRPDNLTAVVGQDHLLGGEGALARMLASGRLTSFILWGPPGCGKTTIARLLAADTDMYFEPLSAVFSGVADLRRVFEAAKGRREAGQATLLFIDEIHRFNKAQQDAFLPFVEDGTVTLVGATTENPSFELNAALLSRCQVFVLNRLDHEALEEIVRRVEEETGEELPITEEAKAALFGMADGDGRFLLNMCEALSHMAIGGDPLSADEMAKLIQKRMPVYDKKADGHYNLISALHKSLRSSDVDAALYWMARMLRAGEDPLYLLRRLTRFAVEDVSMADPQALPQAIAAWDCYKRLGSPEGELAISQLVVYLATAPKSAGNYKAYKAAMQAAKETGSLMPPKNILNAPTKLMDELGYGAGYVYDHDTEDGFSGQNCFPEEMGRRRFYKPVSRGFEREIEKRLAYFDRLRKEKQQKGEA